MKKLKILVIDSDQTYTQKVLSILSEKREFEIMGSEPDGVRGLNSIFQSNPDVVLLDIQLPGMDGLSVLKEMKLMKKPPVAIICTHFYSDFCIVSAQQNGAAYILYKPIDFRALPTLINECYKSVHCDTFRVKQQRQQQIAKNDNAYRIHNLLFNMGIPLRCVGSRYLAESVLMVQENRTLLNNLTKGLYAEMGNRLNTSPGSIERSLRSVISATYERGNLSDSFDNRPTNKQFLLFLLQTLNDEQVTISM